MSLALVLIGLSGSGKSTVGRLLGSRLHLDFIDVDRQIEDITGMPVSRIFATAGEPEFRRLETIVLAQACGERRIIATGGGAVLRAENRAAMRKGNLVAWLDVPTAILASRLSGHARGEVRPLLRGDDLQQRLATLHAERQSLYAATAHVRCAAQDGGASGSHRIATELSAIYAAWVASERASDA